VLLHTHFNKNKKNSNICYDADVTAKLLIQNIDIVVGPITYIVNLTLTTGISPTELKWANVIPIHKAGDPCPLNNYRLNSLLSLFYKIFKRVMYTKIMNFLGDKSHTLLSPVCFRS